MFRTTRRTTATVATLVAVAGFGASAASPAQAAASQYGAMAMNPTTGAIGVGYGYSTLRGAQRRAKRECGSGCKNLAWVMNGCIAVGYDADGFDKGVSRSRSAAKRKLLRKLRAEHRYLATVCA